VKQQTNYQINKSFEKQITYISFYVIREREKTDFRKHIERYTYVIYCESDDVVLLLCQDKYKHL